MRMKKAALLLSMISILFTLTACSSGTEEVSFDYTANDIIYSTVYQAYQIDNVDEAYRAYLEDQRDSNPMAEILQMGIENFDSARSDCGEFVGYRSTNGEVLEFDIAQVSSSIQNAQSQEELDEAQKVLTDFLSNVYSDIEEDNNGNVIVKLKAVYEDRDAEYSFVYEENPEAAYSYELSGQTATPYKIKEITVTPSYTTKEIMGKAAANTLMGMGTVFIVLIFISIIIGQFEKISKLVTKISNSKANKNKDEEDDEYASVKALQTTSDASAAPSGNIDDTELVAVITAAVVAANVASGGSDNLIVRSIRKARR